MKDFEHILLDRLDTLNQIMFSIGAELRALRQTYVEQKNFDDTVDDDSTIYSEARDQLANIIAKRK